MMLAVGCIQSLQCNQNTCPTGVATQKEALITGLNVKDKGQRVFKYHNSTIYSFLELIGAAGLDDPDNVCRKYIKRRISMHKVDSYADIYPPISEGCLLQNETIPKHYHKFFNAS